MKRLLDKRIVIIGAGSCGKGVGNGKAMAILFAEQGGKVLCIDSDPKAAHETVEEILKSGGDAAMLNIDITDVEARSKFIIQGRDDDITEQGTIEHHVAPAMWSVINK